MKDKSAIQIAHEMVDREMRESGMYDVINRMFNKKAHPTDSPGNRYGDKKIEIRLRDLDCG